MLDITVENNILDETLKEIFVDLEYCQNAFIPSFIENFPENEIIPKLNEELEKFKSLLEGNKFVSENLKSLISIKDCIQNVKNILNENIENKSEEKISKEFNLLINKVKNLKVIEEPKKEEKISSYNTPQKRKLEGTESTKKRTKSAKNQEADKEVTYETCDLQTLSLALIWMTAEHPENILLTEKQRLAIKRIMSDWEEPIYQRNVLTNLSQYENRYSVQEEGSEKQGIISYIVKRMGEIVSDLKLKSKYEGLLNFSSFAGHGSQVISENYLNKFADFVEHIHLNTFSFKQHEIDILISIALEWENYYANYIKNNFPELDKRISKNMDEYGIDYLLNYLGDKNKLIKQEKNLSTFQNQSSNRSDQKIINDMIIFQSDSYDLVDFLQLYSQSGFFLEIKDIQKIERLYNYIVNWDAGNLYQDLMREFEIDVPTMDRITQIDGLLSNNKSLVDKAADELVKQKHLLGPAPIQYRNPSAFQFGKTSPQQKPEFEKTAETTTEKDKLPDNSQSQNIVSNISPTNNSI